MEGPLWSLTIWLGPIVLAVVIAYALIRRRRLTRTEVSARDRATHQLYDEKN